MWQRTPRKYSTTLAGSISLHQAEGRVQRVPELLPGAVSGTLSTRSAFCSSDASSVLLGDCRGTRRRKGWCADTIMT